MMNTNEFRIGDRVKITGMSTDYPGGNPLSGAEGTVTVLYPWREPFDEFDNYITVKIDKSPVPLTIGVTLMFRKEDLQFIIS